MIKRPEFFQHVPCIKAQLEAPIAKMQLENIPKLFESLGYSVEVQTNIEEDKTTHKICIYRGGSVNPTFRQTIYIEEIGR
ncbi:MAG: hypothetical protein ACE5R6_10985 [Candidatus Heimdallarchaeota archaeon]